MHESDHLIICFIHCVYSSSVKVYTCKWLCLYICIYHQHWYGTKNFSFSLKLLTVIEYHFHTALVGAPVGNTEWSGMWQQQAPGGWGYSTNKSTWLQQMLKVIRKHLIICSYFVMYSKIKKITSQVTHFRYYNFYPYTEHWLSLF